LTIVLFRPTNLGIQDWVLADSFYFITFSFWASTTGTCEVKAKLVKWD